MTRLPHIGDLPVIDTSRDRIAEAGHLAEVLPEPVGPPPGPVVAAVIYYKQTPERLEKLVRSCEEHGIDGIVFVDGPYEGLSDDPTSAKCINVLHSLAADFSGDLDIWQYAGRVWTGEPQKRTFAARAALQMVEYHYPTEHRPQPWFLYLDSDEFLTSDIDWDVVRRYGWGTAQLFNYPDGVREEGGEGDGALMSRLFPNTDGITFGPAHYDIRDTNIPITYMGWELALHNEMAPAFTLGHDTGAKTIQAEYDAYNDGVRYRSEGKVMRVVENPKRDGRLVIRIDRDSAELSGWNMGVVIKFGHQLMSEGSSGYARVVRSVPTENPDIIDLEFEEIDDEQAAEGRRQELGREAEDRAVMTTRFEKRMKKRLRRIT